MADVKELCNITTLGPYSFRIFVDCSYTEKYMQAGPKPKGRRAVEVVGHGVRKRPTMAAIRRTATHVRPPTRVGSTSFSEQITAALEGGDHGGASGSNPVGKYNLRRRK